jgi:hypothetical protein
MVYPDIAKWDQSPDDLRRLSLEAAHARTRERFQALYLLSLRQTNATQWAAQTGRNDETVLSWVHTYNQQGPDALSYRRSGGRLPLFRQKQPARSSPP